MADRRAPNMTVTRRLRGSRLATAGARLHQWIYRRSGGRLLRRFYGVPLLVLVTRGRRSGQLRRTPLLGIRDGETYVVVASNGGHPRHPDWYRNLEVDPDVLVEVDGRSVPVRARVADGEERERLWAEVTRVYPGYDLYQADTEREIPVVILDPTAA